MEEHGEYNVRRDPGVIRADCFRTYADPRYQEPSPDEVKSLQLLLGLSNSEAAALVGSAEGRGFRRYTAPKDAKGSRQITYSAWRLMVLELYRRARLSKGSDFEQVSTRIQTEPGQVYAHASFPAPKGRDIMDPAVIYQALVGDDESNADT